MSPSVSKPQPAAEKHSAAGPHPCWKTWDPTMETEKREPEQGSSAGSKRCGGTEPRVTAQQPTRLLEKVPHAGDPPRALPPP